MEGNLTLVRSKTITKGFCMIGLEGCTGQKAGMIMPFFIFNQFAKKVGEITICDNCLGKGAKSGFKIDIQDRPKNYVMDGGLDIFG